MKDRLKDVSITEKLVNIARPKKNGFVEVGPRHYMFWRPVNGKRIQTILSEGLEQVNSTSRLARCHHWFSSSNWRKRAGPRKMYRMLSSLPVIGGIVGRLKSRLFG